MHGWGKGYSSTANSYHIIWHGGSEPERGKKSVLEEGGGNRGMRCGAVSMANREGPKTGETDGYRAGRWGARAPPRMPGGQRWLPPSLRQPPRWPPPPARGMPADRGASNAVQSYQDTHAAGLGVGVVEVHVCRSAGVQGCRVGGGALSTRQRVE